MDPQVIESTHMVQRSASTNRSQTTQAKRRRSGSVRSDRRGSGQTQSSYYEVDTRIDVVLAVTLFVVAVGAIRMLPTS